MRFRGDKNFRIWKFIIKGVIKKLLKILDVLSLDEFSNVIL